MAAPFSIVDTIDPRFAERENIVIPARFRDRYLIQVTDDLNKLYAVFTVKQKAVLFRVGSLSFNYNNNTGQTALAEWRRWLQNNDIRMPALHYSTSAVYEQVWGSRAFDPSLLGGGPLAVIERRFAAWSAGKPQW